MKFNIDKLSSLLNKQCPEVVFAFLHGYEKGGLDRRSAYLRQGAECGGDSRNRETMNPVG